MCEWRQSHLRIQLRSIFCILRLHLCSTESEHHQHLWPSNSPSNWGPLTISNPCLLIIKLFLLLFFHNLGYSDPSLFIWSLAHASLGHPCPISNSRKQLCQDKLLHLSVGEFCLQIPSISHPIFQNIFADIYSYSSYLNAIPFIFTLSSLNLVIFVKIYQCCLLLFLLDVF